MSQAQSERSCRSWEDIFPPYQCCMSSRWYFQIFNLNKKGNHRWTFCSLPWTQMTGAIWWSPSLPVTGRPCRCCYLGICCLPVEITSNCKNMVFLFFASSWWRIVANWALMQCRLEGWGLIFYWSGVEYVVNTWQQLKFNRYPLKSLMLSWRGGHSSLSAVSSSCKILMYFYCPFNPIGMQGFLCTGPGCNRIISACPSRPTPCCVHRRSTGHFPSRFKLASPHRSWIRCMAGRVSELGLVPAHGNG